MTITPTQAPAADPTALEAPAPVVLDLYRDIHKGIRSELFAIVLGASSTDPADAAGRAALAGHVGDVMTLLVEHAEHEDDAVQPALETALPDFAARIHDDHEVLEARIETLRDQAATVDSAPDTRRALHLLNLDLAAFTSAYLAHQDLEERQVMPALEAAIGVPAVVEIHQAIVGPMPPEELARSLAIMLPVMNVEDRVELLGGIQENAPAEAFEGIWGLANSVLDPDAAAQLGPRLGR